jgi:hypothetical protein
MTSITALKSLATAVIFTAAGIAGAAVWSGPARAEHSECTGGPRDKWVGIDAAAAKAASLGYTVRKIEIDDGCYEVEGTDKNGAKVKLNLDPVTTQPVPHNARKLGVDTAPSARP